MKKIKINFKMKELEIFRKGFPQFVWDRYYDKQLDKEAIMRVDCDNVNEVMFNGIRRYVKIII